MQRLKSKLYDTKIDFVGRRKPAAVVSVILVVLSWVFFFTIGPNWGIDFTGGTEIHLRFDDSVGIAELRGALKGIGLEDDAVQQVGASDSGEYKVRIQDAEFGAQEVQQEVEKRLVATFGEDWIDSIRPSFEIGARLAIVYNGEEIPPQDVTAALKGMSGVVVQLGKDQNEVVVKLPGLAQQIEKNIRGALTGQDFTVMAIDAVGPKVGGDLRRQGFISIAATLVLVLLYVGFRFDLAFAPGAIIALFHDISITIGIFVLLQKEFNLPIIGALLTIVGYSLNDTIVIYDRIRENSDRYRRQALPELINVSINETLARTLATSLTTLFAISAFLFMGGPVIQTFAFALLLGIIFGTYSTVFVASPMILVMNDLKPMLSKLIVNVGSEELESEEEAAAADTGLTESEKRRRDREQRVQTVRGRDR